VDLFAWCGPWSRSIGISREVARHANSGDGAQQSAICVDWQPLKRYVHLEPVSMTLFGKSVFEDVTKVRILRRDQLELGRALNPMIRVLIRAEKRKAHTTKAT